MRWLAAAVLAGCSAAPAIGPEPAFDAGQDASPATGGNAQGGAPAGGAAGSGGVGGLPGAGGGGVTVTAACDVVVGGALWAVAGIGGKSAGDLTGTIAYRDTVADDNAAPGLSRRVLGHVFVGDGKVGVLCGFVGVGGAPSITFELPP